MAMDGNWRYRCTQNIAHCRWSGTCLRCLRFSLRRRAVELESERRLPAIESLRIPVQYLANLLTAGDTDPVLRALKRMLAMRHYKRCWKPLTGKVDTRALEEVGLTEAQVKEMYRYLAIANYEDRFVVPSSHRELAREAFPENQWLRLYLW